MKIRIFIRNNNSVKSVYADNETNELYIDDTIITTGVTEFIQSAIDIIKDWDNNDDNNENDQFFNQSLKITYSDDKEIKNIEIKGNYPSNFYKLSNLIFKHQDPILYAIQENQLTHKDYKNKED